jgi:hypothetical protein
VVTAAEAGPPLPDDQKSASDLGSVFRWRFTTSDGLHYVQSDPERVAFACGPADLKIAAANNTPRIADAADLASHQPSAGIVRIRNVSDRPCAVEGYPQITGITRAKEDISPNLELFGVSGGLKSGTAPQVILLAPGKTASAAVDSADETPAGGTALCNTLTALTVALPTGELLGTVNLLLRVCDFEVHPLVPGGTGTMN